LQRATVKSRHLVRGIAGIVRRGGLELGDLLQAPLGVGAALSGRLLSLTAEVIEDFVARDAAQPTPEGIPGSLMAKVVHAGSHGLKNVLDDIVGVRSMHTPLLAPV